jgi:heme O synthase-like polyprenyltransferase
VAEESRLDRELIELLNELRVALPGVQVLFAFLLAVPFTQRFEKITELQKYTFFAALLATMGGTVLMISPTAYHRIRFRDRDKEQMLRTANRLALGGTVFLAIAMTATVFLITDMLFKGAVTAVVTAVTAGLFAWFWYVLPLSRKVADERGAG